MSALQEEIDDNFRVRKAQEYLAHCREGENELRRRLAEAVEATKRAKEKYENLFMDCEARAAKRRKDGRVEQVSGY